MTDQIIYEINDGYAVITLNKPKRRNALGTESMTLLLKILKRLASDPAINALVLTGSDPAFCAGSDLKELGGLSISDMQEHEEHTAYVARQISFLTVPVIAAVNGYALGGGFILATSCDIVVSGESTKWNMPEVKNGWIPPWGLQSLLARVGPVKARLITWGVMDMDGSEAFRVGVADEVVPDAKVLECACNLAKQIATLPPNAVSSTKRFFNLAINPDSEQKDALSSNMFGIDCHSNAAKKVLDKFTVTV